MNIFIGMETSGQLRRRFTGHGHLAISCDILPTEDGDTARHIQGDVFETINYLLRTWFKPDLAIFHPSCTYLTNSAAWAFGDGPYHQQVKPGTLTGAARKQARDQALEDVRRIMALPIKCKVIENPIGAISTAIRKPDQIIHPYEFGDNASKATCLWFIGPDGEPLPDMALPIDPAKRFAGRMVQHSGRTVERWSNQTDSGQNRLTPGAGRWKDRSRTYPGIADAMASFWG